MYTTHNETISTIVVTEYIDMYCDRNIKDHNTEYHMNSYSIEGGTSVDVSELPRYTPNICYYYPSIDAPSNGNSRENGYVFGV